MEQSDIDRFCKYIDFTDTCWLWTGSKCPGGYGQFRYQRIQWMTHRFALVLAGETLIKGLDVCHSCRNKHCVNPAHLRQDTKKSNAYDRIADGTAPIGENCGTSKLTEEQVLAIRASDKSQKQLAKEYNVAHQSISKIIQRKNWKHI